MPAYQIGCIRFRFRDRKKVNERHLIDRDRIVT
jgi:hypothetical protein